LLRARQILSDRPRVVLQMGGESAEFVTRGLALHAQILAAATEEAVRAREQLLRLRSM
jgi:hypothetical protein